MASEKKYSVNRTSNRDPRTPPVEDSEIQRKEYYIRRVFREDVRQIKTLLQTDITQFTQGTDIVKELLWSFHHPNYSSYFHSISYFLTSLGFRENLKENRSNLTVFRKKLPKAEHSIHVKVIEQVKAFNIHIHMDKRVHVDHEHNKFTSFLLNKLRNYLENIYMAAFASNEMNIIPKKLSLVAKRSSTKSKVKKPSGTHDKINSMIVKFKSRFECFIPEVKSKSISESLERKNLISKKRMREIAYQIITSSWRVSEIQRLRHIRHNIDAFLKGEIDVLYLSIKKNYQIRKNNTESLPDRQTVSKKPKGKNKIQVSLTPVKPSPLLKSSTPTPKKKEARRNVPSAPEVFYRITPDDLKDLKKWGYFEDEIVDEEEEFRRYIGSPVTEDIIVVDTLPIGKSIKVVEDISSPEIQKSIKICERRLSRKDFLEKSSVRKKNLKKEGVIHKATEKNKKITIPLEVIQRVGFITLWTICLSLPFLIFYFIFNSHYLFIAELFFYFPFEMLICCISAILYGSELEGIIILLYRTARRHNVGEQHYTAERVFLGAVFGIFTFLHNWWFLSLLF